MLRTTTPFIGRPTTRGKLLGGRAEGRAASAGRDDAELRRVALDLLAFVSNLSGFADSAKPADGKGALRVLAHGRWFMALMSGDLMFPYIADVAKGGALNRAVRAVVRVMQLCKPSEELTHLLVPGLQRLKNALNLLPRNVNQQVDQISDVIRNYLVSRRTAKVASRLPDVSKHFRFSRSSKLGRDYHEANGWLGIPGKVMLHRRHAAQTKGMGAAGNDAAQLIADRFGAPGGEENTGPKNWRVHNGGTYQELEAHWDMRLANGHAVFVRVIDVNNRGNPRPFLRRVFWTEIAPDGRERFLTYDFANMHTPENRWLAAVESTDVQLTQLGNMKYVDFARRRNTK